jgi:hypothetical protein
VNVTIMKRHSDGKWRDLVSGQHDLCLGLKTMFDTDCPVRSGVATESREFILPLETTMGDYFLIIDAYSKFKERITCVHAALSIRIP